jgi:hypothetical protein
MRKLDLIRCNLIHGVYKVHITSLHFTSFVTLSTGKCPMIKCIGYYCLHRASRVTCDTFNIISNSVAVKLI